MYKKTAIAMSDINTSFEISRLLHKEMKGLVLTEEEKSQLDEWLERDKGNRQLYDQVQRQENLAQYLSEYNQTDTDAQLILLHDKLAMRRRIYRLRIIFARAAIVLLTIGIGYWFLLYQHTFGYKDLAYLEQHDIAAGYNRAKLHLSSGEEITLDSAKNGLVSLDDGLAYEGGDILSSTKGVVKASLSTPRGGQYKVTLSDGTRVWLNAASELSYPLQFTQDTREVELMGEAYFEVEHNPDKPFIVRTAQQRINVLGTHFAVRAYGAQEATTLVEGKVEVVGHRPDQHYILAPSMQAVFNGDKSSLKQVDISGYIGWKEGKIIGRPVLLLDLLPDLERWYDIDFDYDPSTIPQERAHVNIDRSESLSAVLRALCLTYDVNFEIKGREVRIRKQR